MKSNYENDKKLEEVFGKWLDDNFYESLAKQELILGWYRVNGRELQKKGKDVIIIKDIDEEMIIDEKATLHYINKDIPTFAFEVMNRTSGKEGWLFNEELETQWYLLAWPFGINSNVNKFEFTSSKLLLISRKNVLELLKSFGVTKQSVFEFADKMQKIANRNNNRFKICNGISLNFNFTLREKPVNIVVKRDLLISKASFYGIINQNETIKINRSKF